MVFGRLAPLLRERGELLSRTALAVAQAAAIAWFSPGRGLPLDDAWIHQVVARTFAETGTLGYAPGQHGAAATSYLWAALLAIDFKVLHVDPSRWALFLNGASAIAAGQLLYALLARARPALVEARAWRATSLVVTALACASPNILWFTCSGMEAMPFVALSLAAIWAATDTEGRSRAAVAGIAAGALALLRPEAAPLGGILAAHALARRRTRSFLPITVPWLTAVGVYVASNLVKTGHLLPSTLSGRRWLWFEMSAGRSRADLALDFLDAWATRLGTYTIDASLAATWVLVAVAAFGAVRLARAEVAARSGDGLKLLLAWAILHAGFYVLLLPTPGHGGRYQPLTPLLFATFLPIGAALLLRDLARVSAPALGAARFAWFALLGVAPVVALATPAARALREANGLAVAHIQATELAAGAFIAGLPEGAVASFDIGGAGFASERRVLDLGGLSEPRTAALLKEGRIATWLEENHVRFVVLPQSYEPVLPVFDDYRARLHLRDTPALRLEAVRVFETPVHRWVPSIRATWNAAPKQIVYEVHYTGRPRPDAGPLPSPDARRSISDPASLVPRRDRVVAEHMLATLEAWGVPVDVRLTNAREPASGACAIAMGAWGFDVAGCAAAGDASLLRTIAYEQAGRYLDAGDLGGALRALPHVIARVKRRAEPRFDPPLAPLMPPTPGGGDVPGASATRSGLALLALALIAALGIEAASRRELRLSRALAAVRARVVAKAAALGAIACMIPGSSACGLSDTDVAGAVHRGPGAVALAIAHGGDVGGAGGRVPLLEAAAIGDAETIALLLASGADLEVRAPDEASPLHVAARGGHAAAVTLLAAAAAKHARCDRCAPDAANLSAKLDALAGPRRRTPLHDAVLAGSLETVSTLLAAGADPNALDTFGASALHLAALVDPAHAEAIARALLVARADPKIADARGFTALHAAAVADNARVVALLAERPSLLEMKTPAGETALDLALRYERDRGAEALVRAGASITREDAWPPLHDAARLDAVERAALLLASGADPTRPFRNKTALDVAMAHRSKRVEALLRERFR